MTTKKAFCQPVVDSDTVAELSKKLLEANNELKKAETERKAMLENISHDLRAPLTAIRSTIDYLVQRNSEEGINLGKEEMNAYLKLLDNRTKTMEVLIQDLFLLTCLENGREDFQFENIPFVQFLEEYFFAVEIDEKYKDYNLVLDIDEEIDAFINADVGKLSRVLDNLFSNARKYSATGSTITLGGYIDGENAVFYVKDNGYGIPQDAIPFVFDRTFRVSDSRTPEKENSNGLGLSIASSIVENHNGKISCDSKEGDGSIFTVKLPLVRVC